MNNILATDLEELISKNLCGQGTKEDNIFLIHFVEDVTAWAPSIELFNSANGHVRYFAANIVYTKLRKHLNQLSDQKKEELYSFFPQMLIHLSSSYVSSSPVHKSYVSRLILATITLYVRARRIQQLSCIGLDMVQNKDNIGLLLIGLELLAAIPSEAEEIECSRQVRKLLDQSLACAFSDIMCCIDEVVTFGWGSLPFDVWSASLKVTREWAIQGLDLCVLYFEHKDILIGLISSGICLEWDQNLAKQEIVRIACSTLRECCDVGPFSTNFSITQQEQVAMELVAFIKQAWSSGLKYYFNMNGQFEKSSRENEDLALEVSQLLATFMACENYFEILCSQSHFHPELFDIALHCGDARPRKVGAILIDLWITLGESIGSDRERFHTFLQREVFLKVLSSLLSQCMYPHNFSSWDSVEDDDVDDFCDFRGTGDAGPVQELVLLCANLLGKEFIELMVDFLRNLALPASNSSWWIYFEVCMFFLCQCTSYLRHQMRTEVDATTAKFLEAILHQVLGDINGREAPVEFSVTVCMFLGGLTFALTDATVAEGDLLNFFFPVLDFLFAKLYIPRCAVAASCSLLKLCTHGSLIIINDMTGLEKDDACPTCLERLSSSTAQVIAKCIAADIGPEAVLKTIEATVRTIVKCARRNPDLAVIQIEMVTTPILDQLERAILSLNTGNRDSSFELPLKCAEIMIQFASQIIQFCDVDLPRQSLGIPSRCHLLLDFLSSIWPLLQQLHETSIIISSTSINSQIFILYGRTVTYLGPLILPLLHEINSAIIVSFKALKQGSCLECAYTIIELLTRRIDSAPAMDILLFELLTCVCGYFEETVSAKDGNPHHAGYESECIEALFSFIYGYLVLCPQVLAASPVLPKIPLLCVACLRAYKECGPVRSALHVLQGFFNPVCYPMCTHKKLFLQASLSSVHELVMFSLNGLSGEAPSTLWMNLIETLWCICHGCNHIQEAGGWLSTALTILLSPAVDNYSRQRICKSIMAYAVKDKKRFTSLCYNISKINQGEKLDEGLLHSDSMP